MCRSSLILTVKTALKAVDVSRSYREQRVGCVLWHTVYVCKRMYLVDIPDSVSSRFCQAYANRCFGAIRSFYYLFTMHANLRLFQYMRFPVTTNPPFPLHSVSSPFGLHAVSFTSAFSVPTALVILPGVKFAQTNRCRGITRTRNLDLQFNVRFFLIFYSAKKLKLRRVLQALCGAFERCSRVRL